ncbi:hypothetical protein J6590_046334, partial [Homalodisca vitripennis]
CRAKQVDGARGQSRTQYITAIPLITGINRASWRLGRYKQHYGSATRRIFTLTY